MMGYRARGSFSCAMLVGATLGAAIAGCGEPGAPQPPSLNLPVPVRDLAATRTGNTVHLTWKSTTRTTDRAPVTGTVRTRICRMEGSGPCELVTDEPWKLGQPAQFDDALPSEELQGQQQLLTYYVELLNHAQKSAGRSNAAYSASGQAAPELTSLTTTLRPEGVELHWAAIEWPAASYQRVVRLTRLDQSPARPKPATTPGSKGLLNLSAPPAAAAPLQTLEVPLPRHTDPRPGAGEALDRTAQFGESYRYEARCIEKMTLEGHAIEIVGELSKPAIIVTRDVFPPAVPQQLGAAGDIASHAIDLSWSPDSEPDLAGYVVYRREVTGTQPPERVSGPTPLPSPSFHDVQVRPEVAYAYSVTAVDTSGNESARSAEMQETLSTPR